MKEYRRMPFYAFNTLFFKSKAAVQLMLREGGLKTRTSQIAAQRLQLYNLHNIIIITCNVPVRETKY